MKMPLTAETPSQDQQEGKTDSLYKRRHDARRIPKSKLHPRRSSPLPIPRRVIRQLHFPHPLVTKKEKEAPDPSPHKQRGRGNQRTHANGSPTTTYSPPATKKHAK